MTTMLDHDEVRQVNAVRTLCKRLDGAGRRQAWEVEPHAGVDAHGLGRLSAAAEAAEAALFNVLNTARSFCAVDIPDELIFNREAQVEV
jgi:hypothetical protein